jgi:hypothetical protein
MTSRSPRPRFIPGFFIIYSPLNRATPRHSAARLALRCIEHLEEGMTHAYDGHIL